MSIKASQAKTPETKVKHQVIDHSPLFGRSNLILMALGLFIIAAGMFLMAGGKNTDPNVFDYRQVYSTTRVTVAPVLIVIGLALEIYAIFKKTA